VYRRNDSTDDERGYTANLYYAELRVFLTAIPPGTVPVSSVERWTTSDSNLTAAVESRPGLWQSTAPDVSVLSALFGRGPWRALNWNW